VTSRLLPPSLSPPLWPDCSPDLLVAHHREVLVGHLCDAVGVRRRRAHGDVLVLLLATTTRSQHDYNTITTATTTATECRKSCKKEVAVNLTITKHHVLQVGGTQYILTCIHTKQADAHTHMHTCTQTHTGTHLHGGHGHWPQGVERNEHSGHVCVGVLVLGVGSLAQVVQDARLVCRCSSEAMSPTTRGFRLRKGQSVRLSSNSAMLSLVVTQQTSPHTRLTRTVIHTLGG
jgi:hypothetical protein